MPPPPPPTATADPHLVAAIAGPSPVVGPGPAPPTIAPTPSGGCLVRAGHKRFFFDANQNLKGGYLRISEVVRVRVERGRSERDRERRGA